jgi:hypothetical protein
MHYFFQNWKKYIYIKKKDLGQGPVGLVSQALDSGKQA